MDPPISNFVESPKLTIPLRRFDDTLNAFENRPSPFRSVPGPSIVSPICGRTRSKVAQRPSVVASSPVDAPVVPAPSEFSLSSSEDTCPPPAVRAPALFVSVPTSVSSATDPVVSQQGSVLPFEQAFFDSSSNTVSLSPVQRTPPIDLHYLPSSDDSDFLTPPSSSGARQIPASAVSPSGSTVSSSPSRPLATCRSGNVLHLVFPVTDVFKCTENGCSMSFHSAVWTRARRSLLRHLKCDHSLNISSTVKWCSVCGDSIPLKVNCHVCFVNSGNTAVVPSGQSFAFSCDKCPFSCPSKKGIRNHLAFHKRRDIASRSNVSLPPRPPARQRPLSATHRRVVPPPTALTNTSAAHVVSPVASTSVADPSTSTAVVDAVVVPDLSASPGLHPSRLVVSLVLSSSTVTEDNVVADGNPPSSSGSSSHHDDSPTFDPPIVDVADVGDVPSSDASVFPQDPDAPPPLSEFIVPLKEVLDSDGDVDWSRFLAILDALISKIKNTFHLPILDDGYLDLLSLTHVLMTQKSFNVFIVKTGGGPFA